MKLSSVEIVRVHLLVDQQFGYVRLTAPSTARLCANQHCVLRDDQYSVLFHYFSLGTVTAMPRGLHAISAATHL